MDSNALHHKKMRQNDLKTGEASAYPVRVASCSSPCCLELGSEAPCPQSGPQRPGMTLHPKTANTHSSMESVSMGIQREKNAGDMGATHTKVCRKCSRLGF